MDASHRQRIADVTASAHRAARFGRAIGNGLRDPSTFHSASAAPDGKITYRRTNLSFLVR